MTPAGRSPRDGPPAVSAPAAAVHAGPGGAFVFLYAKPNRYGLMAVAGAIESDAVLGRLPMLFPRTGGELLTRLPALLAAHRPVILGVSFCSTQEEEIRALMAKVGKLGPGLVAVAGGPHPSGDPVGTLEMGFRAVVVGEGEIAFREIARRILSGKDLAGIRGIVQRDPDGTVRRTPRRPPLDLDCFPPWCAGHRKVGPIEITRGCPHGCSFCQATFLMGARVRHRSPQSVAAAVAVMANRGMIDARFITPDAFAYGSPDGRSTRPEAIESLLRAVRGALPAEGRIFFGTSPSEVRPEHVSPAMLDLLRRYAANDTLVIGAQTGSPRLLEACRRGHTVEDVHRAVKLTVVAGFTACVDFILGLPGENAQDQELTLEMLDRLVSQGAVINAHSFLPLPGTPFAGEPAGKIAGRVRERVRELTRRGVLFGEWHCQERRAPGMTGNEPE